MEPGLFGALEQLSSSFWGPPQTVEAAAGGHLALSSNHRHLAAGPGLGGGFVAAKPGLARDGQSMGLVAAGS